MSDNLCVHYTDVWKEGTSGYYCAASGVDFKTQNSITIILLVDEGKLDRYGKCSFCERSQDGRRCKFALCETRNVGPHVYKCTNTEAIRDSSLMKKLEDI